MKGFIGFYGYADSSDSNSFIFGNINEHCNEAFSKMIGSSIQLTVNSEGSLKGIEEVKRKPQV